MIIAGDTSGDHHGAKLVQAMRQKNEDIFFCGIGGNALKREGVRLLLDTSALSVVGVTEIFSKLHHFLIGAHRAKTLIRSLQPDLVILVDFPGFNLPFSRMAKKEGAKILYYISPQVWAWRRGRVKKIRERIDHMAVILPFEEKFFSDHGISVSFVGHPLLDTYECPATCPPIAADNRNRKTDFTIGLLPGSRDREIERHLPVMLNAAVILKHRLPNARFLISMAPSVDRDKFEAMLKKHGGGIEYELISDGVRNVFNRCGFAIVCSGTATLEAALCGIPIVIMYRVSLGSYLLGKILIKGVDRIGLANLIAGKDLVPELIQTDASAEKIADTAFEMIQDTEGLAQIRKDLLAVRDMLGGAGAAERTAEIALEMMLP